MERLKQDLLAKVRALGRELPVNTLDELIDQLGGPERVAEMTGRKGRVVSRADGTVAFESRGEQGLSIEHVNLREKERFMSGEKLAAKKVNLNTDLTPFTKVHSKWIIDLRVKM